MEDVVVVTKDFTYVSISGINSFPTSKSLSLQIDKILKKHIVLKKINKKHIVLPNIIILHLRV